MQQEKLKLLKGREYTDTVMTKVDVIDGIISLSKHTKTNSISLLGFYTALQRLIDTGEALSQKEMVKRIGISNDMFYTCLKALFNSTLLDVEKIMYVQYEIEVENPGDYITIEENYTVFSSITNTQITFDTQTVGEYIAKTKGYKAEKLHVVKAELKTVYLLHAYPSTEAVKDDCYFMTRDWDEELQHYLKKGSLPSSALRNEGYSAEQKVDITPSSAERKEGFAPPSAEQKEGSSAEQKTNNIYNNIIYNNKDDDDRKIDSKIQQILSQCKIDNLEPAIRKTVQASIKDIYFGQIKKDNLINGSLEYTRRELELLTPAILTCALEKLQAAKELGTKMSFPSRYLAVCIIDAIEEMKFNMEMGETLGVEDPASQENVPISLLINRYIESNMDASKITRVTDHPHYPFAKIVTTDFGGNIEVYWDQDKRAVFARTIIVSESSLSM